MTYQTKVYSGLQYSVSIDQNQEAFQGKLADDGQLTTHVLSWDKDFGQIKNYFTLISSRLSFDKATSHQEKNLQLATKTEIGKHHISLAYGTQSTGDDGKNTRTLRGYNYKMEKSRVSVSTNILNQVSAAGVKLGTYSLVGLGYFRDISDKITLRATAGQLSMKAETANTFNGGFATNETENKASIIALGGVIKF